VGNSKGVAGTAEASVSVLFNRLTALCLMSILSGGINFKPGPVTGMSTG